MRSDIKRYVVFVIFVLLAISTPAKSAVISEETIGEYVRKSGHIIYGDLGISEITDDKVMIGKLTVIEELKGKSGEKELDIRVDMKDPNNYMKLKSDLTNLNISASEGIEASGSVKIRIIAMLNREENGDDYLRLIPLFRPDKYEMYLYSYKEIVSMTNITDKKKLLKTIKYNLGEEFSYSLYYHCFDEIFKLDLKFSELFSTIKEFLILKGKKKKHSWFKILKKTGKVLDKSYDEADEKAKEDFFSYFYESYTNEPEENEYANKRFLELIYDLRRLIIKNKKWQKNFYEAVKERKVLIDSLDEDHFRNVTLKDLKEKVMRSLSK